MEFSNGLSYTLEDSKACIYLHTWYFWSLVWDRTQVFLTEFQCLLQYHKQHRKFCFHDRILCAGVWWVGIILHFGGRLSLLRTTLLYQILLDLECSDSLLHSFSMRIFLFRSRTTKLPGKWHFSSKKN